jgi:hypothetical protein
VIDPNETAAVEAKAYRLQRRAKWWSVEVPEDWYVKSDHDGSHFIGGLYHERLRQRIRVAQWNRFTSAVGLVGGILGITAFVRAC